MSDMALPRAGLLGVWDRVVGPGMPPSETALVLWSCVIGASLAAARLAGTGAPSWLVALGALVAFDLIGGAVCNATATTKAWYSRPGQGAVQRALFVAPHLLYVGLLAWIRAGGGFDIAYAVVFGGILVVGSSVVILTPPRLKRPFAFLIVILGLFAVHVACGETRGFEWFAPALLLKLLAGHLVPDRPAARR